EEIVRLLNVKFQVSNTAASGVFDNVMFQVSNITHCFTRSNVPLDFDPVVNPYKSVIVILM
ncbi:unnamed protein product, partial [marine sediment metagenome]